MFSILLVLLVIVAFLMIGLILLQKSEGTGISGSAAASMFGGVLTGSAAGNFLTKTTAWLATIFFILCIMLSWIVANANKEQKTVNTTPVEETEPAPQQEPLPATPVEPQPEPVKAAE